MARSKTPEQVLADFAYQIGVLAFCSPTLKAKGLPHILLYARNTNLAELRTIEEAQAWLRLQVDGAHGR